MWGRFLSMAGQGLRQREKTSHTLPLNIMESPLLQNQFFQLMFIVIRSVAIWSTISYDALWIMILSLLWKQPYKTTLQVTHNSVIVKWNYRTDMALFPNLPCNLLLGSRLICQLEWRNCVILGLYLIKKAKIFETSIFRVIGNQQCKSVVIIKIISSASSGYHYWDLYLSSLYQRYQVKIIICT